MTRDEAFQKVWDALGSHKASWHGLLPDVLTEAVVAAYERGLNEGAKPTAKKNGDN